MSLPLTRRIARAALIAAAGAAPVVGAAGAASAAPALPSADAVTGLTSLDASTATDAVDAAGDTAKPAAGQLVGKATDTAAKTGAPSLPLMGGLPIGG